jgi:HemK-like putative methylase
VYNAKPLRILDLCSGTGCISFLLHSLLTKKFPSVQVHGWDISPNAVSLAVDNLRTNTETGHLNIKPGQKPSPIQFNQMDIFSSFTHGQKKQLKCDIIISNPPYISKQSFINDTTRSVCNWEPRLALVPEVDNHITVAPTDVFYRQLLNIHTCLARSKVLIMEVGDDQQALRVASMTMESHLPSRTNMVEIWRDWPDQTSEEEDAEKVIVDDAVVSVKGAGKMRAVVVKSFDRVWSKESGDGHTSR